MKYYFLKSNQADRINFDSMAEGCGRAAAESLSVEHLYFGIDKNELKELVKMSWPGLRPAEYEDFPQPYEALSDREDLFICEEGSFIVDDPDEAEARWHSSWKTGFIKARASKITKERLKEVEEDLKKDIQEYHITVLPDTGHCDEHYLEVVRLDDETFAFRYNSPINDEEWEIGAEDDILDTVEVKTEEFHLNEFD